MTRTAAGKLALLSSLYLAQGLPDGFFRQAMPALLRMQGVSLEHIGLSTLVMIPWGFKFLWAPVVDRFGRRRSWIVPLDLAAALILVLLAQVDPQRGLAAMIAGVFVLCLCMATQDVAADGLAVAVLEPGERGLGNGVQVAAYRLGMWLTGGLLLIYFERLGWAGSCYLMAAMLVVTLVPVFLVREPVVPPPPPVHPRVFAEFVRQPGMGGWLAVVGAWKFGEAFGSTQLRPLLVDRELSLPDLGWILGTGGFLAGLLGALVGGAVAGRFDRLRVLVWFGVLQAVAVAGYALLVVLPFDLRLVYATCTLEHFASGLATAALFTLMMDRTRPHAAGTDYTAQASLVVLASGAAAALSGYSAARLGRAAHFLLAAGLCLVAAGLAWRHARRARAAGPG